MSVYPPRVEGIRILLVQGNFIGSLHLRLAIELSGLRADVCTIHARPETVRSTCESMRAGDPHPDLILAEIDLSRESGREVIRSVRESSELASAPLIMIGDGDTVDDEIWARRLGAEGFVARPVRSSDLERVGREIANAWSAHQAAVRRGAFD